MAIDIGERPFKCAVSDKSFSRADNLKQHMTIHTGERTFVCSICHKFVDENLLKKPTAMSVRMHVLFVTKAFQEIQI